MRLSRLAFLIGGLLFSPTKRERLNHLCDWEKRGYAPPSPSFVKRSVLQRFGIATATWVETGTFQGDTTDFLSHDAKAVYTIEPDNILFHRAFDRFTGVHNVHVIHGLSEDILPNLLSKISGDVCFWLDGHYSGGITHRGPTDTPVTQELELISKYRRQFERLRIFIDDMRCFSYKKEEGYPDVVNVVEWATSEKLSWCIEHDIFVTYAD
jgi:hypothetical protein